MREINLKEKQNPGAKEYQANSSETKDKFPQRIRGLEIEILSTDVRYL